MLHLTFSYKKVSEALLCLVVARERRGKDAIHCNCSTVGDNKGFSLECLQLLQFVGGGV